MPSSRPPSPGDNHNPSAGAPTKFPNEACLVAVTTYGGSHYCHSRWGQFCPLVVQLAGTAWCTHTHAKTLPKKK